MSLATRKFSGSVAPVDAHRATPLRGTFGEGCRRLLVNLKTSRDGNSCKTKSQIPYLCDTQLQLDAVFDPSNERDTLCCQFSRVVTFQSGWAAFALEQGNKVYKVVPYVPSPRCRRKTHCRTSDNW